MSHDTYARQRLLPEVGEAGQARIAATPCSVRGADGALVQAEYLARAGVEVLEIVPRAEPEPFRHETAFRFFEARRAAAGAWRALAELRRILGVGGSDA
jgi:molybdopterin/thiamine biosynthesis adenylyltransferase